MSRIAIETTDPAIRQDAGRRLRMVRKDSPEGGLFDSLRKTYEVNGDEVYISLKKEIIGSEEYFLVVACGKNIKLVPTQPYPRANHPDDPTHRKVRRYTGRSPCISLPQELAKPGQLYRVMKSRETGVIWLLRVDSFSYADETSIPPDVLIMK